MFTWLHVNPQGKQGRNTYTLEEFGLTHDASEQRYVDFIKMFLNPREPSNTDGDTTRSVNSMRINVNIVGSDIQ